MSRISDLAASFEQKSKQQAASTEQSVQNAFKAHESALLTALNESEQRTKAAIDAQSRNLQRTALKSWMAVVIPVSLTLLLALGAIATMGWYITGQIEEIARHKVTLEQLKNQGGAIQLSRCGEDGRLCARIDEDAVNYQNGYRVLEGY
ncbi:MbeB family mobilization protein [Larsenimonas rhizosphaerae]|uniref:MbeB family mobilization protein n=1 Tax=Larsenimonas rhizosphaerae TaxID=2944682 RepID=UPI0038996409